MLRKLNKYIRLHHEQYEYIHKYIYQFDSRCLVDTQTISLDLLTSLSLCINIFFFFWVLVCAAARIHSFIAHSCWISMYGIFPSILQIMVRQQRRLEYSLYNAYYGREESSTTAFGFWMRDDGGEGGRRRVKRHTKDTQTLNMTNTQRCACHIDSQFNIYK